MSRPGFLVLLFIALAAYAGAPFLLAEDCADACACASESGCEVCPVCSAPAPVVGCVHSAAVPLLPLLAGPPVLETRTPPSAADSEIPHIPKPALG
jgi:hypothetical protein